VHAMRAYRSRGVALQHCMKVSGECHTTASLPWRGGGRVTATPLYRRLDGTQSKSQGN